MSSYFSGSEIERTERRRPTSTHPRARQSQLFFGDEHRKEVDMPSVAVAYNHQMNAVDRGDQLRSYHGYDHSFRRGPWQALAWSFLIDIALINTYIIQKQEGRCNWKPFIAQDKWREYLATELCAKYRADGATRKRFKAGDEFTPFKQHKHVKSAKYAPCRACKGDRVGNTLTRSSRRPFGEARTNVQPPRKRPRQTNYRCVTCDVAICTEPDCWYLYHGPIM